ncbi:MAG: hypothetical protein AAB840_00120 [Patescibacteria group bacterium]
MARFIIGEAFGFAWSKIKKHFWFIIFWTLGIVVASLVFTGWRAPFEKADAGDAILSIFGFVVKVFLTLGYTRLALKILDDKKGDINDFLPDWQMFWHLAVVMFLYSFIVGVGIILLIFPGIIWGTRYSQSIFLVIDKNMGPIEALKESARITMGSKKRLVLYFLASLGVFILGVLVLIVGVFVALPLVIITGAYIYRKLSRTDVVAVSPSASLNTFPI